VEKPKKTGQPAADKPLSKRAMAALEKLTREAEALDSLPKPDPQPIGVRADNPEADLGKRLKAARESKGLTQSELSALTARVAKDGKGLSRAVISFYESGTNQPGPREMRVLCDVLRITPSELLYGDEDPFDNFAEWHRWHGFARTEAEYYANLTYLFRRLHKHHASAIFKLMEDLLRMWDPDFDEQMRMEAFPRFLALAKQLEVELRERGESPDLPP